MLSISRKFLGFFLPYFQCITNDSQYVANYDILQNNKLKKFNLVNLLHQSKQFHVNPCHCFLPRLKPQLSQCPECHMTSSVCYSTYPATERTTVSVPARQQVRAAKTQISFFHFRSASPLPPTHISSNSSVCLPSHFLSLSLFF